MLSRVPELDSGEPAALKAMRVLEQGNPDLLGSLLPEPAPVVCRCSQG